MMVPAIHDVCKKTPHMTKLIAIEKNGLQLVQKLFQSDDNSIKTIHPGSVATQAARVILYQLYYRVSKNQYDLEKASDPEALHDYRIAVRKTRSLLSELDGVLPEPGLSHFRKRFAEVMKHTGRLRDLEVLIHSLPELEHETESISTSVWYSLLIDLRQKEQFQRKQLLSFFNSDYYTELMADWSCYLESIRPGNYTLPLADTNVQVLATDIIRTRHGKLVKRAKKVSKQPSMERLHKLRKSGKRLRYLLDLFEDIYPATARKKLLKELKKFQDVLGEIQDIEVQIGLIDETFVEDLSPENKVYNLFIKQLLKQMNKKKKKLKHHAVKQIDKFPSFSKKKLDAMLTA